MAPSQKSAWLTRISASSRAEVIICGGAIDSPKMLLLNGIGPAKELESLGIPVVQDLPGVGKHLQDHIMAFMSAEVDSKHNNRYAFESNEKKVQEAEEQWKKDRTGDLALYHSGLWGGFLKHPGYEEWDEFKALNKNWQEFLRREKVPTYEFIANCLQWPPGSTLPEGSSYITSIAFLMNPQSEGSVTLASKNSEDKPLINLAYLEHPYDKRAFREAIRETWTKVYENPEIKKYYKGRIYGPETLSDEDIDAFMKDATTTVWHANGSVVMGKKSDPMACVDSNFRVYGVDGLRVADCSVCPLTTNNHTQATAYLVGQKAAEKLIAQYKLDSGPVAKL